MATTYWVEHYNAVTGRWMAVSRVRGSRAGACALAQAQRGSFNSGTRVVRKTGRTETVTDTYSA